MIFIQENAYEIVVAKTAAILSRGGGAKFRSYPFKILWQAMPCCIEILFNRLALQEAGFVSDNVIYIVDGHPWRRSNWQQPSTGSDIVLAPNRQQTIIWTNADLIHWRIHVAQGGDELTK